ncbi:MAG: hypothetical protein DRO39_09705 [Thermoprotei archaeon]|nr:MAG: hypothetical protein DRO39_09705 [Thermoprotei archaeon]
MARDLTPLEESVLREVSRGNTDVYEIAMKLNSTPSSVASVMYRLRKRGLISFDKLRIRSKKYRFLAKLRKSSDGIIILVPRDAIDYLNLKEGSYVFVTIEPGSTVTRSKSV